MKIKLQNGQVEEVDHDAAVLLIASGKGERVLPEKKAKKSEG